MSQWFTWILSTSLFEKTQLVIDTYTPQNTRLSNLFMDSPFGKISILFTNSDGWFGKKKKKNLMVKGVVPAVLERISAVPCSKQLTKKGMMKVENKYIGLPTF